jgi:hypothetical protein
VVRRSRAALVCLILIAGVDGFIVYLLVILSGMVFVYHEGARGEPTAVAEWSIALAVAIAGPIAGFVLWGCRKSGIGIAVAVLPIVAGLLLLAS